MIKKAVDELIVDSFFLTIWKIIDRIILLIDE